MTRGRDRWQRAARLALALTAALAGLACTGVEPRARGTDVPLVLDVATYNLRLNTPADGPDAWPRRREAVLALIRRHGFDVLGTQEGLADQIDDLAALPEYDHVGVGRDDGRRAGEHAAIFFRRDRFDLLAHGDFWLSETPERPSKGWDARCCHRLASWAHLRERASGRSFHVFSAHFDHEGVVARRESARLLLERAHTLAAGGPLVVVGDFNAVPGSEPIERLAARLRDARRVSTTPPSGPAGTFNGFRFDVPPEARIDHIFVGPGWRVLRHATLADTYHDGDRVRWPSDHLPVVARLVLD
jgi:endonuclease/exonuclease/phosphatase family metal-dependent hydrolase